MVEMAILEVYARKECRPSLGDGLLREGRRCARSGRCDSFVERISSDEPCWVVLDH